MPLTPEQLATETKKAFDKATEDLTPQQKRAVLWELQTQLGGFPPAPNPYLEQAEGICAAEVSDEHSRTIARVRL